MTACGVAAVSSRRLDFGEQLRRIFCYEFWNIGVVEQTAVDIVTNGLTGTVRWLNALPEGVWLADPACLIHPDGRLTLFAEALQPRVGRGAIWSAELDAGQHPLEAQFTPLFEASFHMSYPFCFWDESGRARLTMESWQAGCAMLLHRQNDSWNHVGRILDGREVLDPTIWRGVDRWWLFCTFRDDGPDSQLHLFHALTLNDKWVAHPANPVKRDFVSSRPAGPLFMAAGKLIRPAQDSSGTYGGAVVLNVVEHLDENVFVETPIRRLAPIAGPYQYGLHTFCPAGDFTLIDGKAWKFSPSEFIERARRKITRIGGRSPAGGGSGARCWQIMPAVTGANSIQRPPKLPTRQRQPTDLNAAAEVAYSK